MTKNYFIGGEYLYEPAILEKPYRKSVLDIASKYYPEYYHDLTGGGYYSLKVILNHLKSRNLTKHPILLPSYLCPSILIPFNELDVKYQFYNVKHNLTVDTGEISSMIKVPEEQVLLFIPYFGFEICKSFKTILENLKLSGLTIIEDRAQCLFPRFNPIGNYVFYSFRKFLPVDGSLLLTDKKIKIKIDHYNNEYIHLKKDGQIMRNSFIKYHDGHEKRFLKLLKVAEKAYYQEGIAGFETTNMAIFSRLNIEKEIKKRKEYYKVLYDLLFDISLFKTPNIKNASPLCFPIIIKNDRDKLQNELKEANIFAPVHWRLNGSEVPKKFTDSHNLSLSVLSLPIRADFEIDAYYDVAKFIREAMNSSLKK